MGLWVVDAAAPLRFLPGGANICGLAQPESVCTVMAYAVMAYIVMACGPAQPESVYTVIAYTVTAYIVMAYIAMACGPAQPERGTSCSPLIVQPLPPTLRPH